MKPGLILAVTSGDPAGIGPEVGLSAARHPDVRAVTRVLFVGAPGAFGEAPPAPEFDSPESFRRSTESTGWILVGQPVSFDDRDPRQAPNAACGMASLSAIEHAVKLAVSHRVDGVVTAPISKAAIHEAGCRHPGHTEFIAELCQAECVVMMLTGGGLRVGLATTHTALKNVPHLLQTDSLVDILRVYSRDLAGYFGLSNPRIVVCGLNPHASDEGLFGDEEARIISPAIAKACAESIRAIGPIPGDVACHRQLIGEADAVLAMYHDQGLAPLKTVAFDSGVNVTLGLPIIRTSPDHGTGFDISGRKTPCDRSMREAIILASKMAVIHNKY